MIDYVYEVRGTADPIDGDKVRFKTKDEAMEYYEEKKDSCPEAAVYIIEYEFDDFEGADNATSIPEQRDVVQIAGPGVKTIDTKDGFPDTCAGDNPDYYDDKGVFRLPKDEDDLDEDLVGNALDSLDLGLELNDPEPNPADPEPTPADPDLVDAAEGVDDADPDLVGKSEATEQDDFDGIENESFAEELFSALGDKRSEEVFPEGKLDLEAPHEDVPVVDCKVNPVITHAEDEPKDLVEDSAGVIDDSDLSADEAVCEWCGESKPTDILSYKKNIGLVCPDCASYLAGGEEVAADDDAEPDYFGQDFE